MEDVCGERSKADLVRRHLAGQRHAHHGAAMKASGEGNHTRPTRRGARNLDCVLNGFRSGREEGGLLRMVAGRALVNFLGQRHVRLVGHDLIRRVCEAIQLVANRGEDLRMPMARITHRNTRCKIDKTPAFNVPQLRILGACGVEVAHHANAPWRGGILAALQIGVLHSHLPFSSFWQTPRPSAQHMMRL